MWPTMLIFVLFHFNIFFIHFVAIFGIEKILMCTFMTGGSENVYVLYICEHIDIFAYNLGPFIVVIHLYKTNNSGSVTPATVSYHAFKYMPILSAFSILLRNNGQISS